MAASDYLEIGSRNFLCIDWLNIQGLTNINAH